MIIRGALRGVVLGLQLARKLLCDSWVGEQEMIPVIHGRNYRVHTATARMNSTEGNQLRSQVATAYPVPRVMIFSLNPEFVPSQTNWVESECVPNELSILLG
jgi:hypothetical protein